jgi:hypothetical protein
MNQTDHPHLRERHSKPESEVRQNHFTFMAKAYIKVGTKGQLGAQWGAKSAAEQSELPNKADGELNWLWKYGVNSVQRLMIVIWQHDPFNQHGPRKLSITLRPRRPNSHYEL